MHHDGTGGEGERMESGSGRERVSVRRLRGSQFRQQRVVCFTGAPLVRWDAVRVKASGHGLAWRVQ